MNLSKEQQRFITWVTDTQVSKMIQSRAAKKKVACAVAGPR